MKIHRKTIIEELIKFDSEYLDNYAVIGVDEAGRGPISGPVSASAVCFQEFNDEIIETIKYLNDSKKFSSNPKLRKDLSDQIKKISINNISNCTVEEIDKYNILQASLLAMNKAVTNVISELNTTKEIIVLVDGRTRIPKLKVKQVCVVKGDSKSASIAAASILAKVNRDEQMIKLSEEFPEYEWHQNKGYPTKKHIAALREHGPCDWHRKTFIKNLLPDARYHQLNFIEDEVKA